MDTPASEHILDSKRMEALTDGIFAFAMTLLVLGIDLPENIPQASANQAILRYLIDTVPQFINYVTVFLVLALFWYGHQRMFHFIKYIDTGFLWINIVFLLFVALAPLTTNLAGDYGEYQMGVLPMEIHIIILSLVLGYQWSYAVARPDMLSEELNSLEIAKIKERQILQLTVCFLAVAISFFSPIWSTLSYILMFYLPLSRRYRLVK